VLIHQRARDSIPVPSSLAFRRPDKPINLLPNAQLLYSSTSAFVVRIELLRYQKFRNHV